MSAYAILNWDTVIFSVLYFIGVICILIFSLFMVKYILKYFQRVSTLCCMKQKILPGNTLNI